MRYQFVFPSIAVIAGLVVIASRGSAQDVSAAPPETNNVRTVNLAFSKDGRLLHEIRWVNAAHLGQYGHVRAITYDAATGSIKHVLNLAPDTWFFSATSDGRTAVISVDRERENAQAHLLLVDVETGRTQDIPSRWFDGDHNPYAQISGNGRLVSAYTDPGSEDCPLVVSVYNWRKKKLVAKQCMGYPAGGISWGGVTVDGKIAFSNNRSGSEIVDPKTGQWIARIGPNSYRSQDGAWVVDFPNPIISAPQDVNIMDGLNGRVVRKLDVGIGDDMEYWAWARAAFCGTSGRFIAATEKTVLAFEIPSGKKIADFPPDTWQDPDAVKTRVTVACSSNGKHVAIRSGARLTLHDLK